MIDDITCVLMNGVTEWCAVCARVVVKTRIVPKVCGAIPAVKTEHIKTILVLAIKNKIFCY